MTLPAIDIYATYTIFFNDPAEYQLALAIFGGDQFFGNPFDAAAAVGITVIPTVVTPTMYADNSKGIFSSDYSLTLPGSQLFNPSATGVFLSPAVDFAIAPGLGGFPGFIFPPGSDHKVIWSGGLILMTAPVRQDPPVTPIPRRRYIGGFDMAAQQEGGNGISFAVGCRDSSRTVEGLGMAIRGNNVGAPWQRPFTDYGIGNQQSGWDRFYIRIRNPPSGTSIRIFGINGSVSPASGLGLSIGTSGELIVNSIDAGSGAHLLGTITGFVPNTWYLLDILWNFRGGAFAHGRVRVIVNHALALDVTDTGGQGLDQNQAGSGATFGKYSQTEFAAVIDLDDWVGADIPTLLGVESLDSFDFLCGSHMRKHWALSTFSATNWVGAPAGVANQGHDPNQAQNNALTSSTNGAKVEVNIDVPDLTAVISADIGIDFGCVAAVIGSYTRNVGGPVTAKMGYNFAGVAADINFSQQSVLSFASVLFNPTGLLIPANFGPGRISHTHSPDVNADTTNSLQAVIEHIGLFNACDDPTNQILDLVPIIHNCNYPNTIWSYDGAGPLESPCAVIGGTYVGNGTQQDINLLLPAHFIWIRNISGGAAAGVKWFAASLGGHSGVSQHVVPSYIVRSFIDATGQPKFTVAGTDVEVNQAAATYQYIAFCDPGMRYNLCGAYNNESTLVSVDNPLVDPTFTPIAGFVQNDTIGNASGSVGLAYKGPGYSGVVGTFLNGAAAPNFGSFSAGVFTSRANTNFPTIGQANYSLWRTVNPRCAGVMVQITSYIGNGTNPRTIPLTPASGRFPIFVMVIQDGNIGYMRDPSHAGSNSCTIDTLSNTTTAITGVAIDQITVNASVNSNGTIYNVFAFAGDVAGMNNGTFFPTDCVTGPPWSPPTPDPAEIALAMEGGLEVGESGDTALSMLRDISGIYTIVPNKANDTLYDRQPAQTTSDHAIPNPFWETGYIGG